MEIIIKIVEIILNLFSTSPWYIRLSATACILLVATLVVLYLVRIEYNKKLTESVLRILQIRKNTNNIELPDELKARQKKEEEHKLHTLTLYVKSGIIATAFFLSFGLIFFYCLRRTTSVQDDSAERETLQPDTMELTMSERHHLLSLTNLAERTTFDPSGRKEISVTFTDMKDDAFKLKFVIKGDSERVYAKNEADDDMSIELETNSGYYATSSRANCIIRLKTDDKIHYTGKFEIREIYDADNNHGHQENIVGEFNFAISPSGEKTVKDEDNTNSDSGVRGSEEAADEQGSLTGASESNAGEDAVPSNMKETNSTGNISNADGNSLPSPSEEPGKISRTDERVSSFETTLESPGLWAVVIGIILFIRYATDWEKVTEKLKELIERLVAIFKAILVCGSVLGILYLLSLFNSTNSPTDIPPEELTINITPLNSEMYLSAGDNYTVALLENGQAIARGDNRNSQHQHIDEGWDEWKNLSGISAGHHHTVGLKQDKTAVFDGSNANKQCGIDTNAWSELTMISAGGFHTVGLKENGTVVAVGGNETPEDIENNIQVNYGQCDVNNDDWTGIVQISAGWYHTVGLRSDGSVIAVGCEKNGDQRCRTESWRNMIGISAGRYHTVGITSDHRVKAIGGNNDYGECNTDTDEWTHIIAVSAGCWHTVGLRDDNTVVAVGDNRYHQCDVSPKNGWTDIVAISTGCWHTVGLKKDGTIISTGRHPDSDFGQADLSDWSGIKHS